MRMRVMKWCALGLANILSGTALAQTPVVVTPSSPVLPPAAVNVSVTSPTNTVPSNGHLVGTTVIMQEPAPKAEDSPAKEGGPDNPPTPQEDRGETPPAPEAWGPTPLGNVKIAQKCLGDYCDWFAETTDCCTGKKKDPCLTFSGWIDMDYTFNSTGPGRNGPGPGSHGGPGLAPVMNTFGDEYLVRSIGLNLSKPLDPKDWSWGFNSIFIGGSDASFLTPTAGGWKNTNPRFGGDWTDLNVTAHLPIITDGGLDVKIGRQTTCLGQVGALPWQRYFDSSDYAWYILEEGRYTGVSTVLHVNKQLDIYNGIEVGGWGVFFDDPSRGVNYLGQVTYWLDSEAKKTKVVATVLTGPTGFIAHGGNTTAVEVSIFRNWTDHIYQLASWQMNYSADPLFFAPPAGYRERANDFYSVLGAHVTKVVDINTRVEYFYDADGGGYPGGLGTPKTSYWEVTLGPDYHPVNWLQLRPEIRGDFSNNHVFGDVDQSSIRQLQKDQLTIAIEALIKF